MKHLVRIFLSKFRNPVANFPERELAAYVASQVFYHTEPVGFASCSYEMNF